MDIGTDFDEGAAKYVIRARIEIDGVVDKPDVVGALFGQTEGLLGEDLDLRELQRTGRIGRIQIAIKSEGGHSKGEIVIPVSLNKTATAILAATLETVDRVGPCTAKVTLDKLEDIRGAKRRRVVSRAISILKGWEEEVSPGTEEIADAVSKGSRKTVAKFGPDKLPAGPSLEESDEIIIVEGRADIINLMKSGINNTVAVEGTNVPKSVIDLTKKVKTVIAFLDGDRGGDFILRELMQVAKIDYIARAPEGKEVEELTRREILKALQSKIPADQALALVTDKRTAAPPKKKHLLRGAPPATHERREPPESASSSAEATVTPKPERVSILPRRGKSTVTVDPAFSSRIPSVRESFRAVLFGSDKQVITECGVAELAKTLESQDNVHAVVFDGVVTQRLVDIASKKNVQYLIGAAMADLENRPPLLKVLTFDDVAS
ncbi:MAG: DNA primase [Candidatus Thorarchaeota archaeon]|nr:DNA primase [Candidatus Thorarchaeota archaeon]